MKLDGREIATNIYHELEKRVEKLKKRNIIPHLVVILVGTNPASIAYIQQKQKSGENIGAKVTILEYKETITTEELAKKIMLLNSDPFVNGILIQRPLPDHVDVRKLALLTDPKKDIDGFHPDSPFTLPLPLAIVKVLEEVSNLQTKKSEANFQSWLTSKKIILLGKGETGGKPIAAYLNKLQIKSTLIDSKTRDTDKLFQQADIIISAVGKEILKPELLKKGVILIGVGLFKGETGKLQGDYDVEQIKDVASFYTPTPGGVGPVNVAMLMDNLITATEKQTYKEYFFF